MASVTALAALLATGPAQGFDAAGIDIIGLRLGMQEPEVVATLASQGCIAARTSEAITANTKDGRVQVALSTRRGATEISYVFTGRGVNGPEGIRESILTRFGDPSQAKPPTWCRAVRPDGVCPSDQASLSFLPEHLTLLLRSQSDPRP